MVRENGGGRRPTAGRMAMAALPAMAAVPNGLTTSPLFDSVLFLLRPVVPPSIAGPEALFWLTGAFLMAMTLALAGVPAAMYERLRGRSESSLGSIAIWLIAALLLGLPGALGALGHYELD